MIQPRRQNRTRTTDLKMVVASAVAARFDEAIEAGRSEENMEAVYTAARPSARIASAAATFSSADCSPKA